MSLSGRFSTTSYETHSQVQGVLIGNCGRHDVDFLAVALNLLPYLVECIGGGTLGAGLSFEPSGLILIWDVSWGAASNATIATVHRPVSSFFMPQAIPDNCCSLKRNLQIPSLTVAA